MKKKAQNLVEYLLIAAFVALFGMLFVTKFDLGKFKNWAFNAPTDNNDPAKLKIEAMTKQ